MGRELKRVPMDFDWPIGAIWKGYMNPYNSIKCPYCDGDGLSKEAHKYHETFYSIYFGWYLDHPYNSGWRYCPDAKPYKLERWEYDFIVGNENLSRAVFESNPIPAYENLEEFFLKHHALEMSFTNRAEWELTEEYCRRNGYDHICKHCNGDGEMYINDEVKALAENFKYIEPPVGEGYQLWENTSEGSPQSPVFATLDELCEWCESNAFTFADYRATKEEWKKMFEDDFVRHEEGNCVFF